MATLPETHKHRSNRLLAALPDAHFAKLRRRLEIVDLKARDTIFHVDDHQEYAYFPHSGVICLMAALRTGLAETALIGCEGFVGLESVLGGERAVHRGLVQLPGSASRITMTALRAALRSSPPLRDLLLHYVRFFLYQALQSVACNGLHPVEAPFARWLLTAYDRNHHRGELNLTHEFMAEVLGVHRPMRDGGGTHAATGGFDPLPSRCHSHHQSRRIGAGSLRMLHDDSTGVEHHRAHR